MRVLEFPAPKPPSERVVQEMERLLGRKLTAEERRFLTLASRVIEQESRGEKAS